MAYVVFGMTVKSKLGSMIGRRRSVRRYSAAHVEEAAIKRLLVAATQAPSAHNRQPWRFAVLDDSESKHRLATAMGQRLRKDRTADGDDPAAIEADVARSYARLTQAPLVIVASIDTHDMDRYPDKRRSDAEHLMAVQSTAMSMQISCSPRRAKGSAPASCAHRSSARRSWLRLWRCRPRGNRRCLRRSAARPTQARTARAFP